MAVLDAGLDLEVVPGVTAGLGVPAVEGIAVTGRGVSRAVALVTAVTDWDHPGNTPGCESQIDQVAHVDTVCVYMGLAQLGAVAARLIELGRDPGTPAISISSGCTPDSRSVRSTLGEIARDVTGAGLDSPVLTIIGAAVALRERLTPEAVA